MSFLDYLEKHGLICTMLGHVKEDMLLTLTYFVYLDFLTQTFCQNKYSQFACIKTDLLGQGHLTRKWQRCSQNPLLSDHKPYAKKID